MSLLVGIISDSHDNIHNIRSAVEIFNMRQVHTVLHVGDIVSPFTVRVFRDLNCPMHLVFGNNDGDKQTLIKFFREVGEFHGGTAKLTIGGRQIAMTHGTEQIVQEALVKSGEYDIVISGHTHELAITKENNTLVINPGEACGYLSGRSTVMILDLESMEIEVIDLAPLQSPLAE